MKATRETAPAAAVVLKSCGQRKLDHDQQGCNCDGRRVYRRLHTGRRSRSYIFAANECGKLNDALTTTSEDKTL